MQAAIRRPLRADVYPKERAEEIWYLTDDPAVITEASQAARLFCEDRDELIALLELRHHVPPGVTKFHKHTSRLRAGGGWTSCEEIWVLPYYKSTTDITLDDAKEFSRTFGPIVVRRYDTPLADNYKAKVVPVDNLWVAYAASPGRYNSDIVLEYNPDRARKFLAKRANNTYGRKPLFSVTMSKLLSEMITASWVSQLKPLANAPYLCDSNTIGHCASMIMKVWALAKYTRNTTEVRRVVARYVRDLRYHQKNLNQRADRGEYGMRPFCAWWTEENNRLEVRTKKRRQQRAAKKIALKSKCVKRAPRSKERKVA